MTFLYDAIIIGAGISGLTLAARLKAQNKKFIILEKSSGVGGRVATRRGSDCAFDHGAQFIKMPRQDRSLIPSNLESLMEHGQVWFSSQDSDYIAFTKGMTQLPKSWASDFDLKLNEKVISIDNSGEFCSLITENGSSYQAKQLFITCPLPQSLILLNESNIPYAKELEEVKYAKALVGLFRIETNSKKVSAINYLEDASTEIYSISNQQSKNVSKNLAFTVVMQPTWSEQYFDQPEETSLAKITSAFENALKDISPADSFEILNSQLKKWRYSHPFKVAAAPYYSIDHHKKIFLLGDGFGGGSVLGAARSAWSIPL